MGKFSFIPTSLKGVTIIEPAVFEDGRGFFMESYSRRDFEAGGIRAEFVQDNHSLSRRGTLRGLHFQRVRPQGKLVRVVAGRALDVAVDLRRGSPTFLQWEAVELSAANQRMFYVPPGLAHGFLALEDGTHLLYKCTDYYHPQYDGGILWNDPAIGVDWNLAREGLTEGDLVFSPKDLALPPVSEADLTGLE